jgi:hypothetical protein
MKTALVVLGASLALTSCASLPVEKASAGHVIAPDARRIGLVGYTGEWSPEEPQVATLEEKIGRLFARPDARLQGLLARSGSPSRKAPFPLSDYFIRYGGVIKEGKQVIIGKASHRNVGSAARALTVPSGDTFELEAFGGGSYYFTVSYDPQAEKILALIYNAPL